MSMATYVSFVPRAYSAKVRAVLMSEDTGAISWRERRTLWGSEFYFFGPAGLARTTHEYLTSWLASRR